APLPARHPRHHSNLKPKFAHSLSNLNLPILQLIKRLSLSRTNNIQHHCTKCCIANEKERILTVIRNENSNRPARTHFEENLNITDHVPGCNFTGNRISHAIRMGGFSCLS
ncbi:hypothetical protein LZZ85_27290, partial [Terrimonas sp. NA20]